MLKLLYKFYDNEDGLCQINEKQHKNQSRSNDKFKQNKMCNEIKYVDGS